MNKTYIRCSDPKTISRLKELGYIILSEEGGFVTFLNDLTKPVNFSKDDKVVYTSKLEFGG